jgi:hypothetical protein
LVDCTPDTAVCVDGGVYQRDASGTCGYAGECINRRSADAICDVLPMCGFDAQHAPFAIAVCNPGAGEPSPITVTLADATGLSVDVSVPPGGMVSNDASLLLPTRVRFRIARPA